MIKRSGLTFGLVFGVVFVCLILSFSFASANFLDNLLGKSTGQPIRDSGSNLQKSLSAPNNVISKFGSFFGKTYVFYECIDSEKQSDPTVKGSIYVEYSENGGPRQNITLTDSCAGFSASAGSGNNIGGINAGTHVNEYFCKNTETKKQPALSVIPCDIGKSCEDGACIGGLVCNETDDGKDYPVYGVTSGWDPFAHAYAIYSDQCLNEDELYENYCVWTGEVEREYHVCTNGCNGNGGICIEPAENGNAFNCTDSDSGINAGVKGTVIGPSSNYQSQNWSFTDMCTVATGSPIGDVYYVVEGYCSSNGEANTFWVECPAGCTNGICNPVNGAANGCVDTDNSLNASLHGTVTGTHYGVNGWTLTDTCFKSYNYQEDYLKEGYCKGNQAYYKNVLCETGSCMGGICTPKNVTQGGDNSENNSNIKKENPEDEEGIKLNNGNELENDGGLEEGDDFNKPGQRVGQETGYCKCSGNFESDSCKQSKTQTECLKNVCSGNSNGAEIVKKCVWVSSDLEQQENSNIRFKEDQDKNSELNDNEINNPLEDNENINQNPQGFFDKLKEFFQDFF